MSRAGGRKQLMRVVRHEEGRPLHRGRVHLIDVEDYSPVKVAKTLCGLEMWVTPAMDYELDNLDMCIICRRVPAVEGLARRVFR